MESFAEVLEGWVGPHGLLLLWASFQALPTLLVAGSQQVQLYKFPRLMELVEKML